MKGPFLLSVSFPSWHSDRLLGLIPSANFWMLCYLKPFLHLSIKINKISRQRPFIVLRVFTCNSIFLDSNHFISNACSSLTHLMNRNRAKNKKKVKQKTENKSNDLSISQSLLVSTKLVDIKCELGSFSILGFDIIWLRIWFKDSFDFKGQLSPVSLDIFLSVVFEGFECGNVLKHLNLIWIIGKVALLYSFYYKSLIISDTFIMRIWQVVLSFVLSLKYFWS